MVKVLLAVAIFLLLSCLYETRDVVRDQGVYRCTCATAWRVVRFDTRVAGNRIGPGRADVVDLNTGERVVMTKAQGWRCVKEPK